MLKKQFTTAPILAYPDNNKVFCSEMNASDFATTAVLFIEQDRKWHLVTFSSYSITPKEHNYPIADKEIISVIRLLKQWHHYLEGMDHKFEIWNDHTNHQWFIKHQDLNCHQARWAQYLTQDPR